MIMDENEIQVSKILLQLSDLIAHTRILNSLPFGWGSKKPRTSLSSRNNIGPIASPKLPPKLPVLRLKIKRNIDGKAKEEEPKRKKNKIILPDLNIPLKEEEEENGYHLANNIILPNLNIPLKKGEKEEDRFHNNVDGDLDAIILMRKRAMATEARRRRIQIVRCKKSKRQSMIMDENEVQVSKILLQLPNLIAHTRILNSLPLIGWGSKKPRTSLSSRNNIGPIASPKLPPKVPVLRLKIKKNTDGKTKEEEPKSKKNKIVLDLNIPLKEEEEENGYHLANNIILPNLNIPLKKGEKEEDRFHNNVDGDIDAIILMRKRAMAAEARRRRIQIIRSKKSKRQYGKMKCNSFRVSM
ncbi:uncharacterized protein G2W53_040453 [Senna tora]|uniref:Uncharacterized protein n=1 Tax=Senna tora TaxID=362788 RepID=A0A834SDJ0_9FABA|nr:uncharacterized protein G2W53_040453 [Senna tora]